jgi:xylulokinase
MTQAVIEGVTFGLRDSAEALRGTGAQLDQMLCIGGGSASRYWVRLLATVLNNPLQLPVSGEFGAALGAARLGLCAATGADPDAVMTPPEIGEVIQPDTSLTAAFDDAYAAFRASYLKIKDIQ